ncbi:UDP-3-O-(3-hydroxymyristoyl)glucosamine N-acyltransferase [Sulfitobacter aestuariivivens]|uniref:UDP-3-O-(3-hydroxymyristoyl)glucosamine N-acyltransferase n=1 Tax=Sulfitobacter aestuariivivens TaxID=2766981 RepID=A0A927D2N2_9RHOB|nr:UDP-3-O-(3-hydroxymyristoyl)glucosamine N-acyltransferase [Sulfitobacter aestuariivivens]MBD3663276.1 UDP-3-O-(3-hydroxymyristoyl)glucosamine N-acyltransferase [Sulfitobacter aestuariivivens]
MAYTIAELGKALGVPAVGDTAMRITRLSEPASAGPDDLALAMTPKFAQAIPEGDARAALLWAEADWQALGLRAALMPERPRYAMSSLTEMLDQGQGFAPGIHPSAVVDAAVDIGDNVSIGPFCVISAGARIGDGSVIGPHCFIGWDSTLGQQAFLREHVSIGARVSIGDRFIAQPGVRIAGDGFSFVTPEKSAVEAARATLGDQGDAKAQGWHRIHSLGSVTIGDDVEVGANSTIDCGTVRDTRVGNGTKIDSLVQVGHNAVVGDNTLLCAQAGVAGSSVIGNNVVLGGQTGVSDNIFVGDGVIVGGGSKVLSNVPAGRTMLGYPATAMDRQMDIYKAQRRLPKLLRDVAALRKAVFKSDKDD